MSVKEEINKLNTALEKVSAHLDEMRSIALKSYGEKNADIFEVQKMILNDTGFYSLICKNIEEGCSASEALQLAVKEIKDRIGASEDEYFKAKVSDISDIAKRLNNVINGHMLSDLSKDSVTSGIIIGDELTVSDILLLDTSKVTGIIFNETSEFSHRVIIAKARGFNVSLRGGKTGIISEIAKETGIGKKRFMRTEFVYMNRDTLPDVKEQTEVYSEYIKSENGEFPVLRIFDLGIDKNVEMIDKNEAGAFPELSRGVRKALRNYDILKTQIRSIIRAAFDNDTVTGILVPMVATKTEVIKVKALIDEECSALLGEYKDEKKRDLIKLGIMMETPAACIISDSLAGPSDFFMIGLNDLLQYTYGCDRNSKELEVIFNENKDSVLRLIEMVKKNAESNNISVSICETVAM